MTGPDLDGDLGVAGPPTSVAAVVTWYAPTDLAALPGDLGADPMADDSREAQLLGAPAARVPDLAAEASPVSMWVPAPRRSSCCTAAPTGSSPARRPTTARRARPGRRRGRTGTYEGADHMWLGSPGAAEQALDRTVDFLLAALAG